MTAQARITQADIHRAMKVAASYPNARVTLRLAKAEIDIIVGGAANQPSDDDWNDDDV